MAKVPIANCENRLLKAIIVIIPGMIVTLVSRTKC
jgi:hypothetical protein